MIEQLVVILLPSFDGKLSTNKKYEPVQLNNPIITQVSLAACWEPFQGVLAMILPKIGRIRHYYFFYRPEQFFYFWPFLAHENRCAGYIERFPKLDLIEILII